MKFTGRTDAEVAGVKGWWLGEERMDATNDKGVIAMLFQYRHVNSQGKGERGG
jgi:hypothetical protein